MSSLGSLVNRAADDQGGVSRDHGYTWFGRLTMAIILETFFCGFVQRGESDFRCAIVLPALDIGHTVFTQLFPSFLFFLSSRGF